MASTGGYRATYRTRTYNSKGRVARTQPVPGMRHEQALLAEGASLVGGIDEVGVGAWAGPVAVGAVVLDPGDRIYKLRDSKLLDPARREWLAERGRGRCGGHGAGPARPEEIDEVGLSEAIRRAGARAVAALPVAPDGFLVDGQGDFIRD